MTRISRGTAAVRRSAFTLVEIVVVMVLFNVFLLLLTATIWGSIKIEQAHAAAHDRLRCWNAVADQFRTDVAQAIEAPDVLGELTAGPACLILKMSQDQSVVYRWENGRLLRRVHVAGGEPSQMPLPTGGEDFSAAFARSGAENPLVTLRLVKSRGPGDSRSEHVVEISAALGGDVR